MKSYIELIKKENIIYKLLTVVLVAFIVLFLGRVIKNTIVGMEFPNELLEPANVNLTNAILDRNVPYALENLVSPGEKEPPINYEYPFLNSVFAALFSFVFAENVVLSHYFVSFASMVGTAILGSIIILRNSRTTVGATAGFLLLMFCHWRYGYVSASPDGFGLFITLLTLYMACSPNIRFRPFWCALGTVAAFYSKQYYAAVCISIIIFFFYYSKKEAIKYIINCVILLLVTIVIVTWKWPLYWVYSVLLLMHGCFQGWGIEGFIYVFEQMKYLSAVFAGMVLVIVFALIQVIRKKTDNSKNAKEVIQSKKENDLTLFIIQLPVQIAALLIFGRNDGAYLTYFLQLLIPSVVIATLIIMEQMDVANYEKVFRFFYAVLVIFTIYFGWNKLPMHMLTKEEVGEWKRAYSLIDEYREKGVVYHSQASAYYAIKHNDSIFGTGHDGDINLESYEAWNNDKILKALLPYAGNVFEENLAYREHILEQIKKQEVSLVVASEHYGTLYAFNKDLEDNGYYIAETITLQFGNMPYDVFFWVCGK